MKIKELTLEQVRTLCQNSCCQICPLGYDSKIIGWACTLVNMSTPRNWRFDDTKEIINED